MQMKLPQIVLATHLGGNDLTVKSGKTPILQILSDFKASWPLVRIMWSCIIPRLSWRAQCDPRKIDRARRGVNCEVGRSVKAGMGSIVEHHQLRIDRPEFFSLNGVHLSEFWLDIFLQDLKGGLCAKVFGFDGGQGAYK